MKSRSLLVTFVCILFLGCKEDTKLFRLVPADRSGIKFNNTIIENDSINPIDITNIYNGGGVGVGDFNNDGLQDVYFTGSLVSNKLYLNKGGLEFADITDAAGVSGNGRWCRGISVVDINNDGWLDMYVSAAMDKDPLRRMNLLYVNQGNGKNGVPLFREMAAEYGLADTTHSTMSAFFDYDNDGDLDVYIVVNEIISSVNPSVFRPKITDGSFPSTGRLYRNSMDSILGHPVFKDVSKAAGVTIEGYGHGVNICDINKDGWKDIFISNDFIANDLLYINNHDGTFTDKAASYFKHTSANGMGQDVIDINNDGLSDIIELDMNPEDNFRKKMMMNPSNYQTSQLNDFFKYQYQYVRNTLQLNQGPVRYSNDSPGDPVFSDVGYFAGIAETDWSWAPLVADFDNDGLRDLVVTNGFPKDITDHDFIAYRKGTSPVASKESTLGQIPEVKLHNYAFHNKGNCRFSDVSLAWGLDKPTFANGGVYADLDNDGDLDMLVNNINDDASLYENTLMNGTDIKPHYLSLKLKGDSLNLNGLGTWVELYYDGQIQMYEQTPYRGYLSTVPLNPHFGLDSIAVVDSVIVKWPNGYKQTIRNPAIDQAIVADIRNAHENYNWNRPFHGAESIFNEVMPSPANNYFHTQTDNIDFNIQKLLPHKFSEYGPSLAAGDINGDGLDDLVVSGNSLSPTVLMLQQRDGSFQNRVLAETVPLAASAASAQFQVTGTILFDADGDNDLDLYLARGGYESRPNEPVYQDRFFINDGHGKFSYDSIAVPQNLVSKSCVRAADFDKDGDLDLFIAGRVDPWNYPRAVSSFIYRNDTRNGHVQFNDVTKEVAPALNAAGLVCDALFTDFDNDGWLDLVMAGEWMPVTFLKNKSGKFQNVTAGTGVANQTGWWNSITGADFDNDGDIDYIFGNLGLNSYYKASEEFPLTMYAKDFDNNGSFDPFISLYLPKSQDSVERREFPAPLRDEVISQMTVMKSKFQNYHSYASAEMNHLFSKEQMQDALILKARNLSSVYCRNDGNGKFSFSPLPWQSQLSALNGMIADDFDGDGNHDLVFNTNDFGTDVSIGRYDALNGLVMKGDGKGNFKPLSPATGGIYIPGNGKALVKLKRADGSYLVAASQNRGPVRFFALKSGGRNIPVFPGEEVAEIAFKDGRKQRVELNYGSSFLSQSARFIMITGKISSIVITDNKGNKRKLSG